MIMYFRMLEAQSRKVKVAKLKRLPNLIKVTFLLYLLSALTLFLYIPKLNYFVALSWIHIIGATLWHHFVTPDTDDAAYIISKVKKIQNLEEKLDKREAFIKVLRELVIDAADGNIYSSEHGPDDVSFWYDKEDDMFEFKTPTNFVSEKDFDLLLDRVVKEIYLENKSVKLTLTTEKELKC